MAAAVAIAITALTNGLSAPNQKFVFILLSHASEGRSFTKREIFRRVIGGKLIDSYLDATGASF